MMFLILKLWLISIVSLLQPNQPTFKGGQAALNSFLNSKMIYPSFSKQNCIEATIYVSFQINENGEIINAQIDRGLEIDLDDEALRLIKLTAHQWNLPKDYQTRNKLIIPVNFSLQNYGCQQLSKAQINKAINNYKAQKTLQGVVFTYYKNKNEGITNTKNEGEIIKLKTYLGFDDEFIDLKLEEAITKLKKGDYAGACQDFTLIKNIGSNIADALIAKHCK